MPDDQHVGADLLEVAHGVGERLALRDAGGVLLEAEHVRAESVRGHLERASRPRAGLEEQRHHRAACQEIAPGRGLLSRPLRRALVLEPGREREKRFDVVRPQAFDVQEVAGQVRHTPWRSRRAKWAESPASRIFRAVLSASYGTRWYSTTFSVSSQIPKQERGS